MRFGVREHALVAAGQAALAVAAVRKLRSSLVDRLQQDLPLNIALQSHAGLNRRRSTVQASLNLRTWRLLKGGSALDRPHNVMSQRCLLGHLRWR